MHYSADNMFDEVPASAINYVRKIFRSTNGAVSTILSLHPNMHEESLDHQFVMRAAAAPAVLFGEEQVAVEIETHWLGGRRMYGRWEIADIALFVLLRKRGVLVARKAALLQTKRLYSREISVNELDEADYIIGIGRLADRTDPLRPLTTSRNFTFAEDSVYGAMSSGSQQTVNIERYMQERQIPVYYTFYNPPDLPWEGSYPATSEPLRTRTVVGCRVMPAAEAHNALDKVVRGKPPTFREMTTSKPLLKRDAHSNHGWKLEHFVADELLRCKEGKLFMQVDDPNLERLLYRREAPITSAISITIDLGGRELPRPGPIRVKRRPRLR